MAIGIQTRELATITLRLQTVPELSQLLSCKRFGHSGNIRKGWSEMADTDSYLFSSRHISFRHI